MRSIVKHPDDILRTISEPVKYDDANEVAFIQELANDMLNACRYGDTRKGVGLAANQVGVAKRVIVIDCGDVTQAIANPEIVKRSPQMTPSREGCLSVKKSIIKIPRHKRIKVTGFDPLDGRPVKYKLRQTLAMIVQHEIDHLNGICIVDYLKENGGVNRNGKIIFGELVG